jgi:hypothetical protein
MNQIKATLHDFIASLHLYDYIVFGISGALFVLILLLAILLRKKAVLSLILVLLAFIILIALPISGYNYIHAQLYKTELTNLNIKKLEFSEAIVIKGTITNRGKQSFSKCRISSQAYKGASGLLQELIYPLKPFQKVSIVKQEELGVDQSLDFRLVMEPFTYTNEYNISMKVNCL